jgi:type I restriction-modification system DNA methylase subunit
MPLFQKSVISKYLKSQSKELIFSKWKSYSDHFLNPRVQEDIKGLKEEQYQGEFLEDLFVKILGYTKPASSSEIKFNLTTEYKNVKDSKKADGAIILEDKVKAVIELKGTNTTDLGKIEVQAFGYKNNQPDCVYVITSNFEKLRFYIDNAIEHIEFNLFTLREDEFQLLYLCLGFDNLSQNIAKKIKDESLSEEDVITKKLYKDYSLFKRELHQNLVQLNPQFEPLDLFKKSQKLLDRFLFLFFGEDRHLLPPNSVRLILSDWKDLQDRDVEIPLYDRFKKYFEYLNIGYKGKRYDVFAYNGGLFKPDEILDTIKIEDNLLYKHALKLAEYDFASEVDVNILGHIFENSLNELDEIKAQLEGLEIDKSKTKRKKDGVFYTPKYITKYIVENTVGKLCEEKKVAFEIVEEEYFTDKKRQKKTIQGLVEKLDAYRKWLLQLTICDPACGSGAFLNQALDFLIEEHQYVDELQAKLFGDALVMSDMENSILENNLFGVDLNEESVEIAKLSLWLRTAQPNRKLNDLNGNIKCGNSLIDDATVAGDKAFNWQQAFPKVFEKGGFDVIIGNPPYGAKFTDEEKEYYNNKYKFQSYQIDSYLIFTEKLKELLTDGGYASYIMPNTWLSTFFSDKIRDFVFNEFVLIEINHYSYFVFEDATVETDTYIFKNIKPQNNQISIFFYDKNGDTFSKKIFQDELISLKGKPFNINENDEFKNIKQKVFSFQSLGDKFQIVQGTKPFQKGKGKPIQDENVMMSQPFVKETKENELFQPLLRGSLINRYINSWNNDYWILFGDNLAEPRYSAKFDLEKLVVRQTGDSIISTYDNNKFIARDNLYVIRDDNNCLNLKILMTLLNSKLITWIFRKFINPEEGKAMAQVKRGHLIELPIPEVPISLNHFYIEKADSMLKLNSELQEQSQKFQRTIQRKFELEELPKKLQDWYLLSYAEFIKELGKKKVKLSLSQEAEWEDYFMQESKKALELKATIDATDKAIDKMVYELYGLNEEEIAIVENS